MFTRSLKGALGALVLAATFGAFSPAHAANLILDGDFANGNATFSTVNSGDTIGPWNVTTGSVDLIGGYWQAPSAGGGSVDLNGTSPNVPGGISQIFTAPAGLYQLSFSLSGNPDGPPVTKTVQVGVGGVFQDFFYNTGTNSHSDMQYISESLTFTSTGSPITLSFLGGDNTSFGAVIGNVSVTAAPLPASFMLFASALLGFGFLMWNRRRANAR